MSCSLQSRPQPNPGHLMDITLHQGWSATIHLSDKPFVIEGQVRGSGLQCCPRPGGAGPTQGRCGAQVCSVVPGQGGPAQPRAGAGLWPAVLSQARGGQPDPGQVRGCGLQCCPRPGGAGPTQRAQVCNVIPGQGGLCLILKRVCFLNTFCGRFWLWTC